MPDATDIAWAAGFIDGEGCFALTRRSEAAYGTYCPIVHAAQSNRAPLEKLAALFGGQVNDRGRPTAKGTPMWQWALSGSESIIDAVEQLLPYLVNKHDVAAAVLDYCYTVQYRGYVFTDDEREERMELYRRYKEVKG